MKTLFLGLLKYHVLPILLSIVTLIGIDILCTNSLKKEGVTKIMTVKGTAIQTRNVFSNAESTQAEVELIGALRSDEKLVIMGSSELQDLPYSSHYFLPDSAGIPTTAFGHAYHQNLSIACELLAAGEQLNGANVCIFLSPGWFEATGTNIEAFLEFVRPNFLRRIIHDASIPDKEKMRIARFVYKNFNEINSPSLELMYFKEMYHRKLLGGFPKSLVFAASNIKEVDYNIATNYDMNSVKINSNFDAQKTKKQLDEVFLKMSSNNSIFVDSSYYSTYLIKNGKYTSGVIKPFNNREELDDFFMVVDILKRHNCKATFVLQPLNPHHYKGLENFNWVKKEIKEKLKENNFPLLDLYVTDPKDYKVLFLQDIMHPGNRGWMEINKFLIEKYKHVQKQDLH